MVAGLMLKKDNKEIGGIRPEQPLLHEVLGLDQDQMIQFEELKNQHQAMMRENNDKINQLREQMFSQLDNHLNSREIDSLSRAIGTLVAEQTRLTHSHLQDIGDLCKEDQKEKFESFLKEAINGDRGPGPENRLVAPQGQRPPRPGNGPPPPRN